jgi:hypothetical protein
LMQHTPACESLLNGDKIFIEGTEHPAPDEVRYMDVAYSRLRIPCIIVVKLER